MNDEQQQQPVVVKSFESDFVYRHDHETINNNNCFLLHGRERPADYYECLKRLTTGNWVYRFHDRENVRTITLDEQDLEWMQRARRIGSLTRSFSRLFDDELRDIVAKYKEQAAFLSSGNWFVRTERVSLKNGQYGVGPYGSFEKVIKSLVSSNPGHDCFNDDDRTITLYFLPFLDDLDIMKEFRVFVFGGQVTAISQQALARPNRWLTTLDDEQKLEPLVRTLLNFFESHVKPRIAGYLTNYTMDVSLRGEDQVYFIEPNGFGADYSAGSALFGWEQDSETLCDASFVEFRYTRFGKADQLREDNVKT